MIKFLVDDTVSTAWVRESGAPIVRDSKMEIDKRKLHFDTCSVEDDEYNFMNSSGYDVDDGLDSSEDFETCLRVQPRKLSFSMDENDSDSNLNRINQQPNIIVTGQYFCTVFRFRLFFVSFSSWFHFFFVVFNPSFC